MALFILFVLGYIVGGVSALLVVGLTLANRRGQPSAMEMMRYDVEHSSL